MSIDISLPDNPGSILFGLSGGADSTILLYRIAQLMYEDSRWTAHRKVFNMFTVPRPDGAANYVRPIVDWINHRLNIDLSYSKLYGVGDLPHDVVVKIPIQKLMGTKIFKYLFIAENKAPPADIPGLAPIRTGIPSPTVFLPFSDATKDEIINLYYEYGVEELLTLTHTCSEQPLGACGECYQCLERAWAFRVLSKPDPLLEHLRSTQ